MTSPAPAPVRHCPRCGAEAISWLSAKSFACAACGFVLYLNPAAAVAVILESRGKILFAVRKNDPCRGMLDLPGGFVDPEETAEEAARREVREETGIEIPEPAYLCSLPNRYPYREVEYRTLDLIFTVSFADPPEVSPADDVAELVWVGRDEVDYGAIAFDSLRKAVRRYVETRQE